MSRPHKIPLSVLVVIHTPALDVLLIERTPTPGFWQSVTGSLDFEDEPFEAAAAREVMEQGTFTYTSRILKGDEVKAHLRD